MNPFLAATLSISLDYGSTKYALSQGAMERNPVVSSNLEAIKIAEIALIGGGLHLIERKNHRFSKKLKIGLFIVHGALAAHNIRDGMRAK